MVGGIAAHPASWGVFSWNSAETSPWETVLDEMSGAGYRGLELGRFGYFPTDSEHLAKALDRRDLSVVGGFVVGPLDQADQLEETLGRARQVASLLGEVGARYLVVIDQIAGSPRGASAGRSDAAARLDDPAWRNLVHAAEEIGRIAREHGLETAFHPHAGTNVEFEDEIDRLMDDADPSLVGLCLDTGHSLYAGVDPVELFDRHRPRVHYLHLKDIDLERLSLARSQRLTFQEAVGAGVFCPLGDGAVDLEALSAAIEAQDFTGWAAVEQDRLTETDRSARQDAEASLACLRAVGIAEKEEANT